MTKKPSRSEIEAVLSGQKSLDSKLSVSTDDIETPRRPQVIGGNLAGISGRQVDGRRARYTHKPNYLLWIGAGIVVSILLAFFWPSNKSNSTKEISKKPEVQLESFYTESRIDSVEQYQAQTQSFSRDTDKERAEAYRKEDHLEKQIKKLLSQAQQQMDNNHFTKPEGDNAIATYQGILTLDASNNQAKQGIEQIKLHFLELGMSALEKNNQNLAQSSLETLNRIDVNSTQASALSEAVENWQSKHQIARLAQQAQTAIDQQNLILPANTSALQYYQAILAIDGNNQIANDGIQEIADIYIEKANQALVEGEFEAASAHLATVSVISPSHPSIPLVRDLIAKAKPIAALARDSALVNQDQQASQESTPASKPAPKNTVQPIIEVESKETLASEQEQFDVQYLKRGLEAYYLGNYDKAKSLLEPLADKGIARAQCRIAYMHFLGRGFTKNRAEADRIIRAALPAVQKFAKEGRSWAQSDLGSLYEDGLALPKDYTKALYWYRAAAQQGYAGAQTNLGIMYARGLGVKQSQKTAIEWFKKAAAQGDVAAKRNLEILGVK